jgi:ethanolamine ammonia-lyase small subunit
MSDFDRFRVYTQARLGLDRRGHSLGTDTQLDFERARAEARDAVHSVWDVGATASKIKALGFRAIPVASEVGANRETYLRLPAAGRALAKPAQALLRKAKRTDIALILSDGLSARAIEKHALPFLKQFLKKLPKGMTVTFVLAPFSRVGILDPIGHALRAKISIILIGERPGLSAPDSMGIYLTYGPKPGKSDADRNCISNVRPPEGLAYATAADRLANLLREGVRLKLSGVQLKDTEVTPSIESS